MFNNKNKLDIRPNLTSFQQKVLNKLSKTLEVIFANADKNLGPVGVTLERYIRYGLKHLMDKNTYEIISEQEAYKRDAVLRKEIFTWSLKWRKQIGDDTVKFVRNNLKETKKILLVIFICSTSCTKTQPRQDQSVPIAQAQLMG